MRKNTRAAFAAASALALAVTVTACGSGDEATEAVSSATSVVGSAADKAAEDAARIADDATGRVVEFSDGWAKATDQKMTGVFGLITNPGSEDVHLVGVSSDIGTRQELHETVPGGSGMMMREKQDGFVIPAGGELVLQPGGNHIMLMDLTEPVTTGQSIDLTLEFADGTEQVITVSARDFQGGQEDYVGGMNQDG
ncbi:copper chaperone PCu(A)C [uncultured Dietzia sp.]|jgi:copper(I)-binding protein|uniref:copper chaperone PCu(A)C n=1 Tax=uncultured Dietzia sp. TaxID=395519 RepID=UPI00261CB67F|nr:copper chaperone PCu(A)C [uncultured Dietzia sp.]